MDFNAVFNRAVESAINAKKDELIKQTLEEDHNYINFQLEKLFGATYNHIGNVLAKYNVDVNVLEKILNLLNDVFDSAKVAVTGKKVEKSVEGKVAQVEEEEEEFEDEGGENEVLTDDDELVTVDGEGRITIPARVFDKTDFPLYGKAKILGDEDGLYIVKENVFDHKKEFIKYRDLTNSSFRIGVANLLNVEPGDTVKVTATEDGKITIKAVADTHDSSHYDEVIEKLDLTVDKENKITIPNYAIKEADLENIKLYFYRDEEYVVMTSKRDTFKYDDDFEELNKCRFVFEGEALRLGVGKMLYTKAGDNVHVEICNGQIGMWKTW